MLQMFAIFLVIVSTVVSFFSVWWAWGIVGAVVLWLTLTLISIKQTKAKWIPELSLGANVLLGRYVYFYMYPFGCRDYSAAASTLALGAIPITIIGLFREFWWGIALGAACYLGCGIIGSQIDPLTYIKQHYLQSEHEEIVNYIAQTRSTSDKGSDPTPDL